MAGIGFDLRKIFKEEGSSSKFNISIQSLFVTSGPWIISIFTIALIKLINETVMREDSFNALSSVIIYAFVFSIVTSSPISNLITRFISDLIYLKREKEILSVFLSGFLILGLVSLSLSSFYCYFFTDLKDYTLNVAYLFSALNILWFIMVFVSMLKNAQEITLSFLSGMLIVVTLNLLYTKGDIGRALNSFTLGVTFTIFYLITILLYEFEFNNKLNFKWMITSEYYSSFISILFFTIATWGDKIIYWFLSDKGVMVSKGFYFFPAYDFATFLSYLTIIPTTAFFVIFLETDFFEKERSFLNIIEKGGSLDHIKIREWELRRTFYRVVLNLLYFQTIISILFLLVASMLLEYFNIMLESIPLLRITTIDATLQVLFNALLIFLYYFDARKDTILISLLFLLLNFGLTFLMRDLPYEYTGFSYFLSLAAANIAIFWTIEQKLKNFVYYIMTKYS